NLTSKNSSPEDWLKEGAKAYVIQAGGDYISGQVAGTGPQTDITTGEAYAGTGASGATGSATTGSVAGNISRNIFGAAARKGSTDVNSAAIITNALSNEGLKEAFAQVPGFSDLSKDEQSAGINAFKVAFNKDSNAATMLLNQGFQATYKELNNKAFWTGYDDLNQQNTITNYVMSGGSKEDIAAFADQETKLTAAYNDYRIYTAKGEAYDELWNQYNAATTWGAKNKIAAQMRTAWADLQSPETIAGSTAAYNKYADTWYSTNATRSLAFTALNEGWDSITQKNEAVAAGFTTPETYDTYLTDKKAQENAATAQAAQEAKDAEEQAKRVADFGKDLTGGGVQDLGPVDTNTDFYNENSSGMGAYKYDPTSGTYTYTSDDGSTLTLDGEGNITGVTEATDTPWTGLTDTSTGNIRLPKLPSGKTPTVSAAAVSKAASTARVEKAASDPLAAIMGQQQTPVTYQTVMPELAKVFYGGKDFSSTPQKLDEQGQLVQKNPLLGGAKPQTASPLALQDGSEENDVTKLLSQVLGKESDQNSQQDFMNYFGRN
ncbi:MAG: hypothetical protein EBU33_04830, partial [Sphingobacteriia bacterium]|nr:hypothetical protein [Sphingobacteriia bacterium]